MSTINVNATQAGEAKTARKRHAHPKTIAAATENASAKTCADAKRAGSATPATSPTVRISTTAIKTASALNPTCANATTASLA